MSEHKQSHDMFTQAEGERLARQAQLDAIAAIYSSPCCQQAAQISYLAGRVDRAVETLGIVRQDIELTFPTYFSDGVENGLCETPPVGEVPEPVLATEGSN